MLSVAIIFKIFRFGFTIANDCSLNQGSIGRMFQLEQTNQSKLR